MESPLALYRRYRPETFAEVIGQDHVTEPLRAALAGNRVNHAYLFSGPRGCGKTTSARILARALNCEKAPVADPCGECESCLDLGRGGRGSIDVIEIDAASHGGVDDARDLRERAFFAPVKSRYKVYIIDEAHMVSTQGFNALLKLVEEPPPHLRFIFATTEPEKVIPTIRSRTHHYPFRLIPPRLLTAYLSDLCAKEQVTIEPAALPLVVRAGAGSARDSLSVLDQLMGGAGPEGITYALRGWPQQGETEARHDVTLKDMRVWNVPTNARDWSGGVRINGNSIFIFAVGDLCIAHLGHLHQRLTPEHLEALGRIDVLMVPIDGAYTMGVPLMVEVVKQIDPRIVLPMHYWGRSQLDRFVTLLAPLEPAFVWPDKHTIEVAKEELPDKLTVIAVGGDGGG